MKKTISVILVIVILINLIAVKSFAEDTETTGPASTETTLADPEDAKKLVPDAQNFEKRLETQTATVTDANDNTRNVSATGTTYMGSTIFGIFGHILGAFPQIVNQMLESTIEILGGTEDIQHFTIYDTVMGHFELFNMGYDNVQGAEGGNSSVQATFKSKIIDYYFFFRNLSIALMLFTLVYVGVRMATSTLAGDKAKYKKMLVGWFGGLILVFVMQAIIVAISAISTMLLDVVGDYAENMEITSTLKASEIESQIYTDASEVYEKATAWNMFPAIFTMWVLVYYQAKFFIMYIKRIMEIGLLVVISPLVTVVYSVNKAGAGNSSAFRTWLSEIISKALIQVVHAILYLIFIVSAAYISTQHPLIAALFFSLLSRSEKIFKNAIGVKNTDFEESKVPLAD